MLFTKTHVKAMQLTAILMFLAIMHVHAAGIAQQTVTYSGKDVSLQKIFTVIKKQTGFKFFYDDADLKDSKPVTVVLNKESLETALKKILADQPIQYKIEGKTIFITKKVPTSASKSNAPPIELRGKITTTDGEPVAGASVMVKGTNKGTTSDADGNFVLNSVDDNDVLVISGSNIERIEWKINGKNDLSVMVNRSVRPLDEVVFKGYYIESKRFNTGNVSKIDASSIEKQPVSNPLQAIQGRMAGVFIEQADGLPGGNIKLQIRGRNSLRTNSGVNDPLYIIDGVPFSSTSLHSPGINSPYSNGMSPLNAINPADIETIEVLKDADATSIYGSRGSNGVVLITTKKGKPGKTKVDVNISHGSGKIARKMELLNLQQYLEMRREGFKNDDDREITIFNAPDLMVWDTTRSTDWQETCIGGTAKTSTAQISVSGGNKITQIFISGGYYKQGSVFPDDGKYWKGSGYFNIKHTTLNEKLNISLTGNYVSENNNSGNTDFAGLAYRLIPNAPKIYDDNGQINWENDTWENPFASILQKFKMNHDNLITNINVSYSILKNLKLKTNVGYNVLTMKEISTRPLMSIPRYYFATTTSTLFASSVGKTWIIEPQLDFQKKIADGNISILIGTTFQQNKTEGQTIAARGFTSDVLLENISAASSIAINGSNYIKYRYNSVYGRLNYKWRDKYILNVTGRRDGSSRFGPNKKFANFISVAPAWILTNESFIRDFLPFLSFGKLRGSYGTTGSDNIDDYGFMDTYQAASYPYSGGSTLIPTRLANSDYSWETTKKFEIGLELGFLKDRILIGLSRYRNQSSNQLVGYPLSQVTGFPSIQFNFDATVQNSGYELELSTHNIKSSNFSWTSSLNLSAPKSKLLSYPGIEKSAYANIYKVGESMNLKKTYKFTGLDAQTGYYTFEDFNKDNSLSFTTDGQFLEEDGQTLFGGFQNSIQYKGFHLDVLFQYVKQTGRNAYYNGFLAPGLLNSVYALGNQPLAVMNRWRQPGDNADIQVFTSMFDKGADAYSRLQSSDKTITDASFLRLKNISVSYDLVSQKMPTSTFTTATIFVRAQNLFTITNYLGPDPENRNVLSLPPLRMITAGIQITL